MRGAVGHCEHFDVGLMFFFRITLTALLVIGGFNQRQGEALPPQIFWNLSRYVFTFQTRKLGQFILRKIIEIVAT